jgi:D-alanyl-D-alanine dipeptidase
MSHPSASRRVPILKPDAAGTDARTSVPFDPLDPRAREKLVDVRELGLRGHNFYARPDDSNTFYDQPIQGAIPQLFLRESVARLLVGVNDGLTRYGLGLYVLDGYRPIETQAGLWKHFWDHFARTEPRLSETEIEQKTRTFVSDPRFFDRSDPRSWPLHATGAAVDLTLCDHAGRLLDLGTPFDDPTDKAATAYFEGCLQRREIGEDDPRLVNRRILYWSMRDAGFTNYLYEWWHFDWGNQMHVATMALLGEPLSSGTAWYGYTEPETGQEIR